MLSFALDGEETGLLHSASLDAVTIVSGSPMEGMAAWKSSPTRILWSVFRCG